jgi:hypothetical protein
MGDLPAVALAAERHCHSAILLSFPDVQLHIGDAPLGAGPESILIIVVMDSGLSLREPRNDSEF